MGGKTLSQVTERTTSSQIWEQRLQEQRELEWCIAQELIARVREMLATPVEDMRWSPRDVATYFHLAMQLIQHAASEWTSIGTTGKELVVRVEYVGEEHEEQTDAPADTQESHLQQRCRAA